MLKKIKEYLILIIILIFFFLFFLTNNLKCFFNELTGLYCPGCGITRLIISVLKLDFYQAFRYNPLVFCLIILGSIYAGYSLIRYKKIKPLGNRISIILVVVIIIFSILRNISYFDFLAPTVV